MSVWEQQGRDAALTRTVTGAILAPHETQRRVVSGKTGTYSSAAPGKSTCVPLDPGGEMVTRCYRFRADVEQVRGASVHAIAETVIAYLPELKSNLVYGGSESSEAQAASFC